MSFFLKKIFNKIKVYYYYLINNNSRQYFFILISRKIFSLFNNSEKLNYGNNFIEEWCKKKKILDKVFYKKIGLNYYSNFFEEKKSYFLSAKLKEKKLKYKMGGMAHLNLIYNLTKHFLPKNILETGVAFGWSTLVFILSKNHNSNLTCIDLSYPTKSSNKLVGGALPANFKNKLKLYEGVDYKYLKFLNEKKKFFDFIHYDSDKSYNGRKKNYKIIWKILNKNGCFISDDISDNSAFYEFVKINKLNYYILQFKDKYVGVVIK